MLKLITFGPLIFIPIVVIFFTLLMLKSSDDSFNQSLKKLEDDFRYTERKAIEMKVDSFSDFIAHRKSIIKDNLNKRIKQRVESAKKVADGIYEKYKSSKNKEEIQSIIISALRPLLWNDGESFIWIINYNGIFKLAPKYLHHLEGKSVIDFKDASGKYVIKEEIALCKKKKEGFIWDTFTKQNESSDRQYKQVAFVKAFGHYNWYLGSSEYLETATKKSDAELLETIAKIDTMSADYILIINSKGDMLLNASEPKIVGKNIFTGDNKAVKTIAIKIKESLHNSESAFISYVWINPHTKKWR